YPAAAIRARPRGLRHPRAWRARAAGCQRHGPRRRSAMALYGSLRGAGPMGRGGGPDGVDLRRRLGNLLAGRLGPRLFAPPLLDVPCMRVGPPLFPGAGAGAGPALVLSLYGKDFFGPEQMADEQERPAIRTGARATIGLVAALEILLSA